MEELLSELEKKHAQYLSELLDYGALCLKKTEGNGLKLNEFQHFLLFSHVGMHNFAEAIYILCKDARPDAANVLLRSLFEASTNLNYVKQGNSKKKMALFALDGFKERLKVAINFERFIVKYPNRKNSLNLLNEDTIIQLKEGLKIYIEGIKRANNLGQDDHYPKIRSQCEIMDEMEKETDKKGECELSYLLMYKYLSPLAHLNCFGLEYFVSKDGNDYIYDLGQKRGVYVIIAQTFLYYFDSIRGLFEEKVANGVFDDKYEKYCNEIKKNETS